MVDRHWTHASGGTRMVLVGKASHSHEASWAPSQGRRRRRADSVPPEACPSAARVPHRAPGQNKRCTWYAAGTVIFESGRYQHGISNGDQVGISIAV